MLAAILGAGRWRTAFFVALACQSFRAIFAEGAFNAAFVPAFAHLYGQSEQSAKAVRPIAFHPAVRRPIVLLLLAWLFMPQVISILGAGVCRRSGARQLAIALTRKHFSGARAYPV